MSVEVVFVVRALDYGDSLILDICRTRTRASALAEVYKLSPAWRGYDITIDTFNITD